MKTSAIQDGLVQEEELWKNMVGVVIDMGDNNAKLQVKLVINVKNCTCKHFAVKYKTTDAVNDNNENNKYVLGRLGQTNC